MARQLQLLQCLFLILVQQVLLKSQQFMLKKQLVQNLTKQTSLSLVVVDLVKQQAMQWSKTLPSC